MAAQHKQIVHNSFIYNEMLVSINKIMCYKSKKLMIDFCIFAFNMIFGFILEIYIIYIIVYC